MTPDDPDRILLAQGAIGGDADEWLKSELGRTVLGLARIESKVAMEELKVVDPNDANKIRDIQNRIWRADRFEGWMVELIMRGRQALAQYDVRNSDTLLGDDIHAEEIHSAQQPTSGYDADGTAG